MIIEEIQAQFSAFIVIGTPASNQFTQQLCSFKKRKDHPVLLEAEIHENLNMQAQLCIFLPIFVICNSTFIEFVQAKRTKREKLEKLETNSKKYIGNKLVRVHSFRGEHKSYAAPNHVLNMKFTS